MAKSLCGNWAKWSLNLNGASCKNLHVIFGFNHDRNYCSKSHEDTKTIESDSSPTEEKKDERTEVIKNKILAASLPFVHNHGWSKTALTAGAESLGFPGVTHGLFPKGGAELVEYFYSVSNENLVISLIALAEENVNDISPSKPSNKVMMGGVEARLRMIIPYKDRWPEALALMTLPPNIPVALANLLTIVDDICYYAGDRSINMDWYGRRLALAGIYKTTELYMLSDTSPDHQRTWEFLHRRIDEALQLEGLLKNTESAGTFAKDFATATFTTARNILGLNWNR